MLGHQPAFIKDRKLQRVNMSRKRLLCFSLYLVPVIVVVSLLTLLIPTPVVKADSVVIFPDPNLEAAIRGAIDKPSGDICESDLIGLTDLWASSRGISNLTGLEHCTDLTMLYLDWNEISDISPLSGLAGLDQLSLMGNQMSDISPLTSLTSLTGLNLNWNQISDLSPLSGLTSLTWLYLGENQVSDISPLSDLTSLERLYLWENLISDISPLSGITNLNELFLSGNQISDISPLASLTSLTDLSLGDNQISDISPLTSLTSLEWLDFWWNQISDISPLTSLTSLRWLDLGNNQISDISHMAGLTSLTSLYLDDNDISDLTPLSGLTSLTDLLLGVNQISDISSLGGLTNLTELHLGDNQISDIEPLVSNTGLASGDTVDLRGNPLSTISLSTYIPALQARSVTVYWDVPNQSPIPPGNESPAPGATGVSLTPKLQSSAFSDPDDADTHAASQWQIRTESGDYENAVYDSSRNTDNLTTINVPSGDLNYNTTYYWRVMHQDNHGAWSAWSVETSFTTTNPPNQPPHQPRNASPTDGATEVILTPTLYSSDFSDPEVGDAHAASQWQITATQGAYDNPIFDSGTDASNLTTISVSSGTLNYNTTYYWRVRHQDNHGAWSNWSMQTSFTTTTEPTIDTTPPTTPVVTDSGVVTSSTSQLHATWTSSDPESGIAEYQYAIGTAAGETDVIGWTSVGTDTQVTKTGLNLTPGTTYYFSVKAKNGAGLWSDVGVSDGIRVETGGQDDLNVENDINGEVGGCCAPGDVDASAGDLAIVWGMLGLCCGTGLLVAKRLGGRRKE
jgi:Leucine-rich repeat (LRR) protein